MTGKEEAGQQVLQKQTHTSVLWALAPLNSAGGLLKTTFIHRFLRPGKPGQAGQSVLSACCPSEGTQIIIL